MKFYPLEKIILWMGREYPAYVDGYREIEDDALMYEAMREFGVSEAEMEIPPVEFEIAVRRIGRAVANGTIDELLRETEKKVSLPLVKVARLRAGKSLRDVAREADVSLSIVQSAEGGAPVSFGNARKICAALGIRMLESGINIRDFEELKAAVEAGEL